MISIAGVSSTPAAQAHIFDVALGATETISDKNIKNFRTAYNYIEPACEQLKLYGEALESGDLSANFATWNSGIQRLHRVVEDLSEFAEQMSKGVHECSIWNKGQKAAPDQWGTLGRCFKFTVEQLHISCSDEVQTSDSIQGDVMHRGFVIFSICFSLISIFMGVKATAQVAVSTLVTENISAPLCLMSVKEFPNLLGSSISNYNSGADSSELVYNGITPGLGLDILGISFAHVLTSIDDKPIENDSLSEALASQRAFRLAGFLADKKFLKLVSFQKNLPCPKKFQEFLNENRAAVESKAHLISDTLPKLFSKGSGLCGGTFAASRAVGELLRKTPKIGEVLRQIRCGRDTVILTLASPSDEKILDTLQSHISGEKLFCSAESRKEENRFAFVDGIKTHNVYTIKLCGQEKSEESARAAAMDQPLLAKALVEDLQRIAGEDNLTTSWSMQGIFKGGIRRTPIKFTLQPFDRHRLYGQGSSQSNQSARLIVGQLDADTDGSSIQKLPQLLSIFTDRKGVQFESFVFRLSNRADISVRMLFAVTDSEKALESLNKSTSVKIK